MMMHGLGLTLVLFCTVNTISASEHLAVVIFLAGRKCQVMTRVNVALLFSVIDTTVTDSFSSVTRDPLC